MQELRLQRKVRVEESRESGQTAADWCRAHNLNVTQFRRWIHKFPVQGVMENSPPTLSWLSVKVEHSTTSLSPEATIVIRIDDNSHRGARRVQPHSIDSNQYTWHQVVTDLRKSIDGLAVLVNEVFELYPFSPCLFVFSQ